VVFLWVGILKKFFGAFFGAFLEAFSKNCAI
jgi:hypothetical protein